MKELTLGVQRQWAINQSLLEVGAHEFVPCSAFGEDSKVDPEPKEVNDGRDKDESESSSEEMFSEMRLLG